MDKGKCPNVQSLAHALEALKTDVASPKVLSGNPLTDVSTPALDSSIATRTPSVSVPTPSSIDFENHDVELVDVPPAFYKITPTDYRGLSVTAAQRISAGTLIFSEPPLIKISLLAESDSTSIEGAFDQLSKSERRQYLKLFNAKQGRMSEVAGIYNSNCYDIKAFDEAGGSCIGALSSRINHSCLPNVVFSYVPPELISEAVLVSLLEPNRAKAQIFGLMQFRAIKNISKGRELVGNYEKAIFVSCKARIERLRRHYSFECTCDACSPATDFWERSDLRRRQMEECIKFGAKAEKEWMKLIEAEKKNCPGKTEVTREMKELHERAMASLRELESLLIKEGLVYTPLANCYKSLAKWSARGSQDNMPWMRKELEVVTRCFGPSSKRAQSLKEALEIDL